MTTEHNTFATTNTDIEAAVFRRLLQHLDEHKDVQNIELMNLADFCRNCLAKWYVAAAEERGESIDYEAAREIVYGMPCFDVGGDVCCCVFGGHYSVFLFMVFAFRNASNLTALG